MRRPSLVLAWLVAGLCAPPLAWASRCNQTTVVTSTSANAVYSDLSDSPARVCEVEFLANGANGVGVVFDSPTDDDKSTGTRYVAEPGAATSGNSDWRWYGEEGVPTVMGLDAFAVNGTLIIRWSGTSP